MLCIFRHHFQHIQRGLQASHWAVLQLSKPFAHCHCARTLRIKASWPLFAPLNGSCHRRNLSMESHWDPLADFHGEDFALVLLNTTISIEAEDFGSLWKRAKLRGVTDGGLNKLDSFSTILGKDFIPDFVSGDFDSVEPEMIDKYKKKGVEIRCTPSQDATDFTKNLRIMVQLIEQRQLQVKGIYVLLTFDGRLDHIMGVINTLYLHKQKSDVPLYLYSGDSISWLLYQGSHRISVNSGREGDWCGLIPVGQPAVTTTSGLFWNLKEDTLKFGSLVSTSNKLNGSPEVTVTTDAPLLWTLGLKPPS